MNFGHILSVKAYYVYVHNSNSTPIIRRFMCTHSKQFVFIFDFIIPLMESLNERFICFEQFHFL